VRGTNHGVRREVKEREKMGGVLELEAPEPEPKPPLEPPFEPPLLRFSNSITVKVLVDISIVAGAGTDVEVEGDVDLVAGMDT